MADNLFAYFDFNLFLEHSQQQLKCFETTKMATKINNVMVEVQGIIFFKFFAAPSFKHVTTSLANEEEEK